MNVQQQEQQQLTVQDWVQRIQDVHLGAFTQSMQQISEFTSDDEADLSKLSEMIKQDAGLTTRILRATTSVYRIRRGRINTVSRALVMLGVKEVKKICLTTSLIDGMLSKNPPQELIFQMTMAFHAAIQARLFALLRGDPHSEEVFLSALMRSIGPLAVCVVDWSKSSQVTELAKSSGCSIEEAERQVFGFTLSELSEALARQWNLGEFIPDEASGSENDKRRARETKLSGKLTRALRLGADSPQALEVIQEIEKELKLPADAVRRAITEAAGETQEVAASFGIDSAPDIIPSITPSGGDECSYDGVFGVDHEEEFEAEEPDPMYQLEILRELSNLMMIGGEPTVFVMQVLEGLHKGVGFDRVIFGLLNDAKTEISARLAVGADRAASLNRFHFPITRSKSCVFTQTFEGGRPFWYNSLTVEQKKAVDISMLQDTLGKGDFMLAPIVVGGAWLGIFYADRQKSARKLDRDALEGLNQFAMQASLAFQRIEDAARQSKNR